MKNNAMYMLFIAALSIGCGATSPATATATATAPAQAVLHDAGGAEALGARAARAPLTVLVFFTPDCPVQKAHDARLRAMVAAYAPRGVAFAAVDSDRGADMPAVRAEALRRGLDIPVLEDRDAAVADALGVEFSTHAVVLDRDGRVLYSGAFDSDRTHLTDKAEPYLARALDAALAGRPVEKARTEPLGCPLAKH